MGDLWDDDGFGSGGAEPEAKGEDDSDEGEENLDTSLKDGLDGSGSVEDDAWDDD